MNLFWSGTTGPQTNPGVGGWQFSGCYTLVEFDGQWHVPNFGTDMWHLAKVLQDEPSRMVQPQLAAQVPLPLVSALLPVKLPVILLREWSTQANAVGFDGFFNIFISTLVLN